MSSGPPPSPVLSRYAYERGEGRYKHRWKHDRAGFEPGLRGPVGKCHSSIDQEVAQALLRSGVVAPSPYEDDEPYPNMVFAVYRGVPYVAVPTTPGQSYHGYPWRGRMPPSVAHALGERAEAAGDGQAFKSWMDQYGA